MKNQATEIFLQVMPLFLQYGIKSMTMDDIARHLGISKKTLYKYVSDKSDLVLKITEEGRRQEEQFVRDIREKGMNAIDECFEISRFVKEQLHNAHPSIFYDMQKYYPKAWDSFQEHKENFIATWVEENIKRGIAEGLFRDDLNVRVIRDLFIARLDGFMQQRYPSMKQLSFTEIFQESFRFHIRGIASEKGISYLTEKVKKEKSDNQ